MMLEATRAAFTAWKEEIEAEITGAEEDLAALILEIASAETAAAAELARIGDLDAALINFGGRKDLAGPLYRRILDARKVAPEASRPGLIGARESIELRLAELRKAAIQLDALLAPPALRLVHETVPRPPDAIDNFGPIVMPARFA